MDIAERNRQLLFTLVLVLVVGGVVGYLLQEGLHAVGERERVLGLADELQQRTNQQDYLALLRDRFRPDSRIWKAPAMMEGGAATSGAATLHELPDGRLKVVVFAMGPEQLLQTQSYVYIPAALILIDSRRQGCKLLDIRVNSRKVDLVFEYIYARPAGAGAGSNERYVFLLGHRRWELTPTPEL